MLKILNSILVHSIKDKVYFIYTLYIYYCTYLVLVHTGTSLLPPSLSNSIDAYIDVQIRTCIYSTLDTFV